MSCSPIFIFLPTCMTTTTYSYDYTYCTLSNTTATTTINPYDSGNSSINTGKTGATYNYDETPHSTTSADSSVYYYGYRYYSPELGRWVTRDPIEADKFNLLAFLGNEPISKQDIWGLLSRSTAEKIVFLFLTSHEQPLDWKVTSTDEECALKAVHLLAQGEWLTKLNELGIDLMFSTGGTLPKSLLAQLGVQGLELIANLAFGTKELNEEATIDQIKKTLNQLTPLEVQKITEIVTALGKSKMGDAIGSGRLVTKHWQSKSTSRSWIEVTCQFFVTAKTKFGGGGEEFTDFTIDGVCEYAAALSSPCGCLGKFKVRVEGARMENDVTSYPDISREEYDFIKRLPMMHK